MRLLQARDMAEARDRSIEIAVQNYTLEDLTTWMTEGWHPIVMIGIEYEGINITHWIVITGIGSGGLLVNDPLKDVNMPDGPSLIDYQTFAEISSFGERRERAVVLAGIREPESRPTIR
ncbi:Peptidase_C39 like family protein [Sinorhizobium meliloti]|nr:Peptidase_C39 like family protein [Sinorhizobium meliloti]